LNMFKTFAYHVAKVGRIWANF